jgi:hypothetical protein
MVTVSRDGPFVVTGGVDLIADNIQFAEGSSRENIILFVVVALPRISRFVMVCIEQLILWTTKTILLV